MQIEWKSLILSGLAGDYLESLLIPNGQARGQVSSYSEEVPLFDLLWFDQPVAAVKPRGDLTARGPFSFSLNTSNSIFS